MFNTVHEPYLSERKKTCAVGMLSGFDQIAAE